MRKNKFIINTANKLKKLAPVMATVGMLNCAQLAATPIEKVEEKFIEQELTVRSPKELAEIDVLQQKADNACNFNSLPEKWQKDLINIKAKAIVAKEHGDEIAYQKYENEFDSKFKDYVWEDRFLDKRSRNANIAGTDENYWRNLYFRFNGYMTCDIPRKGKKAVDKAYEESKKRFIEVYGEYVGTDEYGVDQHIRQDGGLKMNSEFYPQQEAEKYLNAAIVAERARVKLQQKEQGRGK